MKALPTLMLPFFLILFFGMYNTGFSQTRFEGIIETKNTTTDEYGEPQQFTMTMYVKQGMVKIHNSSVGSSPASTIIYRGDKNVVWVLNDEDGTYFEIRHEEQPEQLVAPSAPQKAQPAIRKTGKKKRVLGYACDQIIIKGNDQETEIWATTSLGQLYETISKVLGEEEVNEGWENAIMKMGFYPLMASTKVAGKVMESQEATKIDKRSLAQDVFELPAGSKKQPKEEGMDENHEQEKK